MKVKIMGEWDGLPIWQKTSPTSEKFFEELEKNVEFNKQELKEKNPKLYEYIYG